MAKGVIHWRGGLILTGTSNRWRMSIHRILFLIYERKPRNKRRKSSLSGLRTWNKRKNGKRENEDEKKNRRKNGKNYHRVPAVRLEPVLDLEWVLLLDRSF